jgi:hypothetical protein
MTDNNKAFLEWLREMNKARAEIEAAEHEVRIQFEEEAINRVEKARIGLEKAKIELRNALEELEIRKRLWEDSEARLKGKTAVKEIQTA